MGDGGGPEDLFPPQHQVPGICRVGSQTSAAPLCVPQCFLFLVIIVILEVVVASMVLVFFPLVSTELLSHRRERGASRSLFPEDIPAPCPPPMLEMGGLQGWGGKSRKPQRTLGACHHLTPLLYGGGR